MDEDLTLHRWRVVTDDGPEWIEAHFATENDGRLLFYANPDGEENLVAAFAPDFWRSSIMEPDSKPVKEGADVP